MRRLLLSIFFLIIAIGIGPLSRAQPAAKCAACHVNESKSQPETSMAHAMENPATDLVLLRNPKLEMQRGAFHYTVEQTGATGTYTVSDGANSIQLPIHWPLGRNSQTWILERNGALLESLVSFYPAAHGLDATIGDQSVAPKNLEEAVGRPLAPTEQRACFGCHSTHGVVDHKLAFDSLQPGVQCERCHAGAADHQQAITHGKLTSVPIKLSRLSAEDVSTFCGQCHRTWQTVVNNRWLGIINVRFQPYRLALSKCFDGVDRRMSCTGCHNPHVELVATAKNYDARCLACHANGAKVSPGMRAAHPDQTAAALKMPVCPKATENCVSCHMPKVDLPGAHREFTDHNVRIVKAGEPYPE